MPAMEQLIFRWGLRSVILAGALAATAAVGWWAIVYYGVFVNTGMPLHETAPCLFYTSDLCSLAMSLCGGKHPFGLTRYSSDLLWAGIAAVSIASVIVTFRREAPREPPAEAGE